MRPEQRAPGNGAAERESGPPLSPAERRHPVADRRVVASCSRDDGSKVLYPNECRGETAGRELLHDATYGREVSVHATGRCWAAQAVQAGLGDCVKKADRYGVGRIRCERRGEQNLIGKPLCSAEHVHSPTLCELCESVTRIDRQGREHMVCALPSFAQPVARPRSCVAGDVPVVAWRGSGGTPLVPGACPPTHHPSGPNYDIAQPSGRQFEQQSTSSSVPTCVRDLVYGRPGRGWRRSWPGRGGPRGSPGAVGCGGI
jgi:hypothetical protein